MEIKIEKNVPMPEGTRRKKSPYTLALEKMEIGDSFAYCCQNPQRDKVLKLVYQVQKRSKNQKKFRTASTGGTNRRVWRIH